MMPSFLIVESEINGIGQYQLAIDNYNEIIRLKLDYAVASNNRAFVCFKHGDSKSGCNDAKKRVN
jgi:hypothetical protein